MTPNTSVLITHNETNVTKGSVESSAYLGAAVYLSIVGIIAITGNILVLTVILRDTRLRSKTHNLLLVNLACCDLGVLCGGYPLTILSGYNQAWMFGDVACTLSGFMTFFLSLTSMNTMVAICAYRYVMICAPGKAFLLSRRFTCYVILGTWIHSLFWTSLPLLGWGAYAQEPFEISCSLDWANHDFSNVTYLVMTIFFCYVAHVSIMINFYRHISKEVARLADRERERGRRIMGMEDMLHQINVANDQQVTRMCFLVVLVFVGVWTPYAVVCSVHVFYKDLPLEVTALPTMCAKAGCMLNPLVYFATNKHFRLKTLTLLGCVRQDNVVGVQIPKETVRNYDRVSKEGIYLGRETMVVQQNVTMF